MAMQFDEATHTYTLNGRVVPSVTQILLQVVDFSMVSDEVLARKCAIGKALHECIHYDHDGSLDEDSIDASVQPYFDGWRKFVVDAGRSLDITAAEKPMASTKYGYGCTPDIWGVLDGVPAVIELKSSTVIHPAVALQTAAQVEVLIENSFLPDRASKVLRFALQLKPNGKYTVKEFTSPGDFGVFIALRSVWGWKAQHKLGD